MIPEDFVRTFLARLLPGAVVVVLAEDVPFPTPSYDAIAAVAHGTGVAKQYLEVRGFMDKRRAEYEGPLAAAEDRLDKAHEQARPWQRLVADATGYYVPFTAASDANRKVGRILRDRDAVLKDPAAGVESELEKQLDELLRFAKPEHHAYLTIAEVAHQTLDAMGHLEDFLVKMDVSRRLRLPARAAPFVADALHFRDPCRDLPVAVSGLERIPAAHGIVNRHVHTLREVPTLADGAWTRTLERLRLAMEHGIEALGIPPAEILADLRPTQDRLGDFADRLTELASKGRLRLAQDAEGPAR